MMFKVSIGYHSVAFSATKKDSLKSGSELNESTALQNSADFNATLSPSSTNSIWYSEGHRGFNPCFSDVTLDLTSFLLQP